MHIPGYNGLGFGIAQAIEEITVDSGKSLKAANAHTNRGNFYEILYFIEGKSSYFLEGEFYSLEPCDVVFSNSMEIHGIVHNASCCYKRICIHIKPEFFYINNMEEIQNKFDNKYLGVGNHISYHTPTGKILNEKFELLRECLSAPGISQKTINAVLKDILSVLGGLMSQMSGNIPNPLLRRIVEYINENAHNDIGLSSVAGKFFIDRAHLSRIFKSFTKCSVNEYITLIRFRDIKALRRWSKMSMSKAAKFVGFKNYSTFYRAYKKYYGVAPKKNDPLNYLEYTDFNANH